jgi:crotonobetainyl-CoA:carnitine CoA-transferase CaiB-like acyl-CoA transferase
MQLTTEEALKELEAARIPAGPLYTPQQALEDAHIRQAGLLVDTDYPGVARRVPLAPMPVDLSATPGCFRHRAPTLGEHTNAILRELGYPAEEIETLRTKGVI